MTHSRSKIRPLYIGSVGAVLFVVFLSGTRNVYGVAFTGTDSVTTSNLGAVASTVSSHASGDSAMATMDSSVAVGNAATATGRFTTAVGERSDASALHATAFGQGATASGIDATAVGRSARATGENSTAFGNGARATADNATALGEKSNAAFANSIAIGQGVTTTAVNQVVIGNAGNRYTLPGITSAASRAAQVGPTQFVTTDAAGNLAAADPSSMGLATSSDVRRNTEGIAMAAALSGIPETLPRGTNYAVSTNFGTFSTGNAIAIGGAARLTDNVYLNGGGAFGTGGSGLGAGRVGVTYAW